MDYSKTNEMQALHKNVRNKMWVCIAGTLIAFIGCATAPSWLEELGEAGILLYHIFSYSRYVFMTLTALCILIIFYCRIYCLKKIELASALLGTVCQTAPLLGLSDLVRLLQHTDKYGMGRPELMSEQIGMFLTSVSIGVVIAMGGLIIICISLTKLRYRGRWLFWYLYYFWWTLAFPAGFVFGFPFLIYTKKHTGEFETKRK